MPARLADSRPRAGRHTMLVVAIAGTLLTAGVVTALAAAPSSARHVPSDPPAGTAYASTLRLRFDAEPPLPCAAASRIRADLDVPGPGQPDPPSAVALLDNRQLGVVEHPADATTAVVVALDADRQVVRTYRVSKLDDGWWPQSYDECPAASD